MTIFKNNIKTIFTNPAKVMLLFILPFLFVALFVAGESGTIPTSVTIVDNDHTELTKGLIEEIEKSAVVVECDENQIIDQLIHGKVDYALTIPKGYTEKILNGEETYISEKYFINEQKIFPLKLSIQTYINSAVNIHSAAKNEDDFYSKLHQSQNYKISYNQTVISINTSQKTVDSLGLLMQFVLYSGIIFAAMLLADKENNVMTRVLVSPEKLTAYLAEHFLSYVILGVILSVSLTATLKFIFNYQFNGYYILITTMIILFEICSIAFSIMLISICKKSKTSYWVLLCCTTPMVMLGGCYFDVSAMPTFVQNTANFLPTKWIMTTIRDVLLKDSTEKVWISVLVLCAFTIVYMSISRIGLTKLLQDK